MADLMVSVRLVVEMVDLMVYLLVCDLVELLERQKVV